jgi:3'(2'), 5'-bisphosphate nucleotidase
MNAGGLLQPVRQLALRAGAEIMRLRPQAAVRSKADASPVTEADEAAERLIVAGLATLQPMLPVVAEELMAAGARPQTGRAFWLVDPLDGTKSFIQGRDDFTVNIALIEDRRPVLGVVYAPATRALYIGVVGSGALQSHDDGPMHSIRCRLPPADGIDVVVSLMHDTEEDIASLLAGRHVRSTRRLSSSLKFCLAAAGEADLYPRRGETSEWDTAAGHAVLLAAGGRVETHDGKELLYDKPGFRNPGFVAQGRTS